MGQKFKRDLIQMGKGNYKYMQVRSGKKKKREKLKPLPVSLSNKFHTLMVSGTTSQ